jgi:hypothetical protein
MSTLDLPAVAWPPAASLVVTDTAREEARTAAVDALIGVGVDPFEAVALLDSGAALRRAMRRSGPQVVFDDGVATTYDEVPRHPMIDLITDLRRRWGLGRRTVEG